MGVNHEFHTWTLELKKRKKYMLTMSAKTSSASYTEWIILPELRLV